MPPDEMLPEELLSAYLDGEATAEERSLVERELTSSAEWRAVLEELRDTRSLLRDLPLHDAPDGFWADVRDSDPGGTDDGSAGDGGAPAAPASIDARRKRRTRIAGWIAGAGAAAAIVAVVLVPQESTVKPPMGTLATSHAARSSVSDEPASQLAPLATPVRVGKP